MSLTSDSVLRWICLCVGFACACTSASSGGDGGGLPTCDTPTRQVDGLDLCASGVVLRNDAPSCDPTPGPDTECKPVGFTGGCKFDSECTAQAYGRCDSRANEAGVACSCVYGCASDADCGVDQACKCGKGGSTCVAAACRTSSECEGLGCRYYERSIGGGAIESGFACESASDDCSTENDCSPNDECTLTSGGRFACVRRLL